jgi:hypothetical protein
MKTNMLVTLAIMAVCFLLVSCLNYSWTLEMEATFYSETSDNFHRTTRRFIPEDRTRMEAKNQAFLTLVLDESKRLVSSSDNPTHGREPLVGPVFHMKLILTRWWRDVLLLTEIWILPSRNMSRFDTAGIRYLLSRRNLKDGQRIYSCSDLTNF